MGIKTSTEILQLNQVQIKFHKLINNYFQLPGESGNRFSLFSKLYTNLNSLKNKTDIKTKSFKIEKIKKFEFNQYKKFSKKYLNIDFLAKKVRGKKYIDYLLIHGSYATRDFINNWSDLDIIVVLSDNIFRDEKLFNQACSFFRKISLICYRFDLLAHHRFVFITNFDLKYYPQSFLPLVVYQNCFDLSGRFGQLNFEVRDDYFEKWRILRTSLDYLKEISQKKKITLWQYKKSLSIVLILPSLLLELKNIYLYKRHSFDSVKKEFPDLDVSLVDDVSKKRVYWKLPWHSFYLSKYLIMFLPIKISNFLHKVILYPYTHFKIELNDNFLKKMNIFCQQIENEVF